MLGKRIIPCLDVKDGRVVKGVNFVSLRDAGDPAALAAVYDREGADELIFLDITAAAEGRKTLLQAVRRTAEQVSIPLTVGGGIGTLEDIEAVLRAGADKVSLNTAAVQDPGLIEQSARRFGRRNIVVAIDARRLPEDDSVWKVFTHGGRRDSGRDVAAWAREAAARGAGEILLTSMDRDGTAAGYDLELTRTVADAIDIPVIASGGAGTLADFAAVFRSGGAEAALAASVFHYGNLRIGEVKEYLVEEGIEVRQ
ncbi:MAG: imidazole glycerol phosphate synthase subunit HisF [bacterium]|jgi:cyclase